MVCDFGMSDKLGKITLGRPQGPVFLGRDIVEERDYSEQTSQTIDQEVRRIVDESYARAQQELSKNRDKLTLLAETLLEKEVMDADEVKRLLGLRIDDPAPIIPPVDAPPSSAVI